MNGGREFSERVDLRVTPEMKAELLAKAAASKRKPSAIVRSALSTYLKRKR